MTGNDMRERFQAWAESHDDNEIETIDEIVESAAAEIDRLRETLRPFELGTYPGIGEMPADECRLEVPPGRTNGIILAATIGDCRRAAGPTRQSTNCGSRRRWVRT